MSHYHHLSILEREKILVLRTEEKSIQRIAYKLGRSASTVCRELKRSILAEENYSAIIAHKRYHERRKKCRRHKVLSNASLMKIVRHLFLDEQWSPEQIANRLEHEKNPLRVSYTTIYRAIYAGVFDTPAQRRSLGNRGAI